MHELSLAEISRHAFCTELGVDLTQKLSPLSTDLYHMRQTLSLVLCAQFTRQDNQGCISPQARNRPLSTFIPHSTCPLQRIAAKYRQWGADQSSYSYLSLTGSSACWTIKPGGQHALLQACKSCNNIHEMGRELRT